MAPENRASAGPGAAERLNTGDAGPATHRAAKTVRPTHLVGSDQVHFVWELADPPAT